MAAASHDDNLLDVAGLGIGLGDPKAPDRLLVRDISFSLKRGEIIGLIGESGAGKSTIGLATLGYLRTGCALVSGTVLFKGRDVFSFGPKELDTLRSSSVAYVAQSAAASFNPAWPLMRQVCETAVMTGRLSAKAAEARAIALFGDLDLPEPRTFGSRYPHQVSGGQLQRAMVAMALMNSPDLIVFDEPTTALDTTTQFEVLSVFRRIIQAHGAAGIYITHDMGVVAQMACKVMVLRNGAEVEAAETGALLEHPQEDYTRQLVATRQRVAAPQRSSKAEKPSLRIRGLAASYSADTPLLRDIDFDVMPGETLALVGESGSGKSTVSRVICGLLKPSAGDLMLAGEPLAPTLAQRTMEQARRVQLIHQLPDVSLNPRHQIRSTIARPIRHFFSVSHAEANRQADALLERMGLPSHLGDAFPSTLSGGQKQRVCIARALAAKPALLICDEVTSALDPVTALEIVELFKGLQQDFEMACLFISHQLEIVLGIAHRTAVMQKGRILEIKPTSALFDPPVLPYTDRLLTSAPESRVGWMDEVLAHRQRSETASRTA